jgi:hypothetical protein
MATILKVKRLSNPRRAPRRASRKRGKRRSNPALVATLGALNPRRRRAKKVATKRRRRRTSANPRRRNRRPRVAVRRRRRVARNPRRYSRRRRRNTVVVVAPRRRRRSNPHRRTRSRSSRVIRRRRSRNPTLFGSSITSKAGLTLIGGGIAGVVAAKFIPTMLPISLLGSLGGSSVGRTLITGASAIIAGWAAGKVDRQFGEGVLFGGLMQTASVAFNAFLPGVYSSLGIGLGDLMPGGFSVPQNPIRAGIPAPPPANARVTMNGLARAYGSAY